MTREEIEKLSVVKPYRFESQFEEIWYEVGCIDGLKAADAEPNLKSLWHDAVEEPQSEYEFICQDTLGDVWLTVRRAYETGWEERAIRECIVRWAYVKDLLPKGGKI